MTSMTSLVLVFLEDIPHPRHHISLVQVSVSLSPTRSPKPMTLVPSKRLTSRLLVRTFLERYLRHLCRLRVKGSTQPYEFFNSL